MRFLSLFSGIGGMDHGFIKAGFECAGYVELDKFAHKAFQILHDPNEVLPNDYDIRNVSDGIIRTIGHIDAIVGGFPCQAFSIAGKRQGFKDITRGTLFFEIVRIAEIAKPKYLILENVKGLLNHGGGNTFQIILESLDELGYDCEWQVLNSKNFGVPQNRERVFIVASARGSSRTKVFPIIRENNATIKVVGRIETIKGHDILKRIYDPSHISPCLSTNQGGGNEPKILCPVLTPDRLEKRQNGRRIKNNGEPAFTLTAQDRHGVLVLGNVNPSGNGMNGNVFNSEGLAPTITTNKGEGNKVLVKQYEEKFCIRKLTPLECFRLQSYPDEWYHTLKQHKFSDSQLYKMAGNGVTSNVAYEIARKLIDT